MDATIERLKYKNAVKTKKRKGTIDSYRPLWNTLVYADNEYLKGWEMKFWCSDITDGFEQDVATLWCVCEDENNDNYFHLPFGNDKVNISGFRQAFDKYREEYKIGEK